MRFTRQEIESEIPKWLKEEGWNDQPHTHIQSEQTEPGSELVYRIFLNNSVEVYLNIDQYIERIILKGKISLAPELSKNNIPLHKKYRYLYELKTSLLLLGIHITMDDNIEKYIIANIDSMDIRSFVYFNGLSRDKLFNSIYKMGDVENLRILLEKSFIENVEEVS